jgi:hypothetical protein
LLSFPRGTEMFQFPRFPPPALCIQAGVTLHNECWVSPFGHLRIEAQSTAPRSFSQSLTSFIGSWRQGIHRWLFVAWKNKDARACSAVLKVHRRSVGLVTEPPNRRRQRSTCSCRDVEGVDRRSRPAPSKQKRRQSWTCHCEARISLRTSLRDDRPTSAPTGKWFEPHRTNACERPNISP